MYELDEHKKRMKYISIFYTNLNLCAIFCFVLTVCLIILQT